MSKNRKGAYARRKINYRAGVNKVGFKFASKKMGQVIPCESLLERDHCYRLEYDPNVEQYVSQPATFSYITDNGKSRYSPDFLSKCTNSASPFVIDEVKPAAKANTPEFAAKKAIFERLFRKRGIEFKVWTENEIRVEPFLSNLKKLYPYVITPPEPSLAATICEFVKGRGEVPLGALLDEFCDHRAAVYFLLWSNKLAADLHQPLVSSSLVSVGTHQEGDEDER